MPIDLGGIIGRLFGAGEVNPIVNEAGQTIGHKAKAPVADIIFNQGRGKALAQQLNMQPYLDQLELKKYGAKADVDINNIPKKEAAAEPYVLNRMRESARLGNKAAADASVRQFLSNIGVIPSEAGETFYNENVRPTDFMTAGANATTGLNKAQTGQITSGIGLNVADQVAGQSKDLAVKDIQLKLKELEDALRQQPAKSDVEDANLRAAKAQADYLTDNPEARWLGGMYRSSAPGVGMVNTRSGEVTIPVPKVSGAERILNGPAPNTTTPGTPVTPGGSMFTNKRPLGLVPIKPGQRTPDPGFKFTRDPNTGAIYQIKVGG